MHYKRRAAYEARSEIFGRVCVKLGLTPNVLTALSFGFSKRSAIASPMEKT